MVELRYEPKTEPAPDDRVVLLDFHPSGTISWVVVGYFDSMEEANTYSREHGIGHGIAIVPADAPMIPVGGEFPCSE
jgi:hypothetical protein